MSESESELSPSAEMTKGSQMTSESERGGMQIGLKQMLIGFVVVGVGVGLWGRLFRTQPELAIMVLIAVSTLVPYLTAVIMLFRLSHRAKSPGKVQLAASLILAAPIVGLVLATSLANMTYSSSGPGGLTQKSTAEIIEKELPAKVEEPWVWDELEGRFLSGNLSDQEVNDALGCLLTHMQTTKPNGYDQPFHWQADFIRLVGEKGGANREMLFKIYAACLAKESVEMSRLREGVKQVDLEVDYGSVWVDNTDFGFNGLIAVSEVRLDGKPVEFTTSYRRDSSQQISFDGPIDVGEHKLEIDVQHRLVESGRVVGVDVYQIPVEKWPEAIHEWTALIERDFTVFAKDAQIVALKKGKPPIFDIQRLVLQDLGEKERLSLAMEPTSCDLPLAFEVFAKISDAKEIKIGRYVYFQRDGGTTSSISLNTVLKEGLPDEVEEVDVVFRPQPKLLDFAEGVDEMYGEELTLYAVPLERF